MVDDKNLPDVSAAANLSYEDAKEMARHPDVQVRRDLAARGDLKPEILYFLAEDPEADVRRVIAENAATPHHADLLLATDADVDVRSVLAAKVARLAPDLSEDEQDKVRALAYEALMALARDEVVRVRQVLSETLKDMTDAPPAVILELARDVELAVSGPVLEYSPVLTDADLLAIIDSGPSAGGLAAIARRSGLASDPSHAIAKSLDVDAVTFLLGNKSAQIREETLDLIIDAAVEVEPWHTPLVHRPALSQEAVERITAFVATNMLDVLSARDDLDMETVAVVREEVERRLAGDETPDDKAQRLFAEGALDDEVIVEALKAADRDFVKAALVVMADVSSDVVEKIASTHSVKGTVALSWKAGLSARTSTELQQRFSHVPVGDILYPKDGEDYPMSDEDMTWQIDFFQSD